MGFNVLACKYWAYTPLRRFLSRLWIILKKLLIVSKFNVIIFTKYNRKLALTSYKYYKLTQFLSFIVKKHSIIFITIFSSSFINTKLDVS